MEQKTPEELKRIEQFNRMMGYASRHVSSESFFAHKQRLAREAEEEEEEEEEEEGID